MNRRKARCNADDDCPRTAVVLAVIDYGDELATYTLCEQHRFLVDDNAYVVGPLVELRGEAT